ncbi:MAG TPA: ATP-binding protein [Gemmatimonadales bacterium]|nr:ATP-binding protein [Gemmatimonadales bacterium]
MRFRSRLFLALALAGVIPLVFLALGVRREVDRRLTAEYRARVDGAVRSIRADLTRESTAIQGRLGAFAAQLAADDRFRQAVVEDDPAARRWVLDWGRSAIRQAGLAVLQLQDSSGRILSSGQFRQEYDRVRPELPAFLARSGGWPALAEARTPEGAVLALVRSDSFTVAGRRFTLVGGVAAEGRFLGPLPGDSGFAVRLVRGDSSHGAPAAAVAADLPIPLLPLPPAAPVSARLVVTQPSATLTDLRRGVDRWFVAVLLATALAVVAGAAWLSARISRPLTGLAEQTAAIDLDRLDHEFATDRTDEIGALSRLLGAMVMRLRTGAVRLREAERRVAMGDLARQVNHDIKNGLVPIRNVLRHFDEVARNQPASLAELYRERRGTLESSVAYLETLARNYARITPAPSREPCDVNSLVEQLVRGNDPDGRVTAALGEGLAAVTADRLMLRRVLENLIGNAMESLDGRGGTVTVSTEAGSEGGVRITVADTGRGMSREELEHAFDDFFTTKAGGTGLGLSIARRLVLDLGGTLRIQTEPGTGTRAVVELPR